ncbi:hypothetical protein [Parasphingorhabdus sp.]|uniref:hypothetical protein n=1 Tax=Parasphingorhabdus sp. TaxID=2709688 RepID=UPI003001447E
MSSDTKALHEWIDQLEQILLELDSIKASMAAIHVDTAIVELCQIADIDRTDRAIIAA